MPLPPSARLGRFRRCGPVLVRASTDPGDLVLPDDLDLSDPTAVAAEGRAWLDKAWAHPGLREAVRLASPVFAESLDRLLAEQVPSSAARRVRRAVVSLASYVLRWQGRATPFGLFAGVTAAGIGPASASIGHCHRVRLRADAEWVATIVERAERHPGLRHGLKVIADNTAFERDGRIIVHRRADLGARSPGGIREASVRATAPARFALQSARAPITFTALTGLLAKRYPAAPVVTIKAMLDGLVDQGLLITSLRPPTTTIDPLAYLITALREAGAADLDGMDDMADLLACLESIHADLAHHNAVSGKVPAAQAAVLREAAAQAMHDLTQSAPRPALAVDVRLDAAITIPQVVVREAERAAAVLLRLTTQPFGSAAWLDYHARFRERYGYGALVPVADLVCDAGLGFPGGFLGAPRARPGWRTLTDRDAALMALIQRAHLDGARQIVLTDDDVQALTIGGPSAVVMPQRIELAFVLYAPTVSAIDRGDFTLQITGAPRVPTSMAGRFAHLLDHNDRVQFAGSFAAADRDAVVAQLSFPPRRPHNENVVRVAPLVRAVAPLGEFPGQANGGEHGGEIVDVEDLAVTADADQMYLVQVSTGRRVIPQVPHALDFTAQTPPLARFLAEVADARTATFAGFDLGAAARVLPHVPRIVYRRTVLSPARWRLTNTDLDTRPVGTMPGAVAAWRRRWGVPSRVVLCSGELRLPLDLDRRLDQALLTTTLANKGPLILLEEGPGGGLGWVGRPTEFLIPLSCGPADRRPPPTAPPGLLHRPGAGPIVHAHLAGSPARFDDILCDRLPDFVDALGPIVERWWVDRHRDMIRPETDQHLAVTLRLTDPADHGTAVSALAGFATDLAAAGLPGDLRLAPYAEHCGRFGHGDALTAAENLFATDTRAAIAQLRASAASGIPARALGAASMTHLAAGLAENPHDGYRALVACLPRGGANNRAMTAHVQALADPADAYRTAHDLTGNTSLSAAWHARADALAAYRQELAAQRDPLTVMRTLLHQHHVRALGIDPDYERATGRLARAAALHRLALEGCA